MISRRTSKNLPVGTVLATIKGPVQGRNWFATTINPAYEIVQTGGTGIVKLQGTNDVSPRSYDPNPFTYEMIPDEGASWTDIATDNDTVSGTFATQYQVLRIIVSTQGTGDVILAWVRWN